MCLSDFKNEFNCNEDNWILLLENMVMEYCSIGPVIDTNIFQEIKSYTVLCHFCEQYGKAIIEAHLVGMNNHVLAINTRSEIEEFNEAMNENKFDLRTCMGLK